MYIKDFINEFNKLGFIFYSEYVGNKYTYVVLINNKSKKVVTAKKLFNKIIEFDISEKNK